MAFMFVEICPDVSGLLAEHLGDRTAWRAVLSIIGWISEGNVPGNYIFLIIAALRWKMISLHSVKTSYLSLLGPV